MMALRSTTGSPVSVRSRRDRATGSGSFIIDGRGTILGFDQGMEALTGWRAIDVVGQHKELGSHPSARIWEGGDLPVPPLYEGQLVVPQDSAVQALRLGCRDRQSVEVEAVVTRLPGEGGRVAVTVLRVLARLGGPLIPELSADRDELTGLAGSGSFAAGLERDFTAASDEASPLALVLADVDHLRRINDRLGRQVGDGVLRKLAGILRATVEDDQRVARIGGDDFAVLLAGSGRGEARQMAARIRSTVERFRFPGVPSDDGPVRVTLSLGSASFPADADNAADLMTRAREALDEARNLGRNRVWCYMRRPRVPLRVPVFFDGAEPLLMGYSRDLSPSGLFIESGLPIEIGMRCALAFPLPTAVGNVHVIGRVVRSIPGGEGSAFVGHRGAGMGVEFERFRAEDRQAIDVFLHGHEASTLRPENGTLSV